MMYFDRAGMLADVGDAIAYSTVWYNDLRVRTNRATDFGGHRDEVSQGCKRASRAVVVTVA